MSAAFGECGVRRFPAGQTNLRIVEYNYYTNLRGHDNKVSWCSSFVNWCLAQSGIAGTGSALARSWLEWGILLESPVPGCIVMLTSDDPNSWKCHVGFSFALEDFVVLLGGNQLEEVREHCDPVTSVLSYRWPVRELQAVVGTGSRIVRPKANSGI
ncbi:TIGR02594 family protein [Massilia niabensis]|uniref:TIGR02594 family protein n=1 Tax=Massilia niabensis TaxID=544910 RepID=A0ABW0L3T2_9BURK